MQSTIDVYDHSFVEPLFCGYEILSGEIIYAQDELPKLTFSITKKSWSALKAKCDKENISVIGCKIQVYATTDIDIGSNVYTITDISIDDITVTVNCTQACVALKNITISKCTLSEEELYAPKTMDEMCNFYNAVLKNQRTDYTVYPIYTAQQYKQSGYRINGLEYDKYATLQSQTYTLADLGDIIYYGDIWSIVQSIITLYQCNIQMAGANVLFLSYGTMADYYAEDINPNIWNYTVDSHYNEYGFTATENNETLGYIGHYTAENDNVYATDYNHNYTNLYVCHGVGNYFANEEIIARHAQENIDSGVSWDKRIKAKVDLDSTITQYGLPRSDSAWIRTGINWDTAANNYYSVMDDTINANLSDSKIFYFYKINGDKICDISGQPLSYTLTPEMAQTVYGYTTVTTLANIYYTDDDNTQYLVGRIAGRRAYDESGTALDDKIFIRTYVAHNWYGDNGSDYNTITDEYFYELSPGTETKKVVAPNGKELGEFEISNYTGAINTPCDIHTTVKDDNKIIGRMLLNPVEPYNDYIIQNDFEAKKQVNILARNHNINDTQSYNVQLYNISAADITLGTKITLKDSVNDIYILPDKSEADIQIMVTGLTIDLEKRLLTNITFGRKQIDWSQLISAVQ